MKRRQFTLSLGAAAVLTACGGGGGGGGGDNTAGGTPAPAPAPSGGPGAAPAPAGPVALQFAIGTNLASMELGDAIRYGASTLPNVNFTVPRQSDIDYLASNGFTKNRLPIRWEMLQPVLNDTKANADTLAKIGVSAPGEFHPGYAQYITEVLDEHAKAGTKCIIDVHNYCRYTDFVYQPDGSVKGLQAATPFVQAYTSDHTQVQFRIMALAAGATLTIDNYVDLMKRIAQKWKDHPGLGGYGMMNEPYAMPKPGSALPNDPNLAPEYNSQDLTIWPTFAAAAVKAMRAIDPQTLIYLGGNNWHRSWGLGTENPGFPLDAANIVYEVHCYLDSTNSGQGADWDLQVSRKFTAGISNTAPIDEMTGYNRLKIAVDYAKSKGMALAVTETGMPSDDPRWLKSWENMIQLAKDNNIEVFSWAGGSHWQHRGQHVTNIPGWYQNKPVQSQQAAGMMDVAQKYNASIFDAGTGYVTGGGSVSVTVYARGALQQDVTLTVTSDNGGTFNGTSATSATVTIPKGANGSAKYTFTPKANAVTTLTYASTSAPNVPPPRKVYSLTDPVAYESTNRTDAAMAILAKYSAAKWEMKDGYTDPLTGTPFADGGELRAVSDSGYMSTMGDEMEMLNWFNTRPDMGPFKTAIMRTVNGRKAADLRDPNAFGLWCHKRLVQPMKNTDGSTNYNAESNPVEIIPYGLDSPHFAIAAISVPSTATDGFVFQAGATDYSQFSALYLKAGKMQARWVDPGANELVTLNSATLAADTPTAVSLVSTGSAQTLRVGSSVVDSRNVALTPAQYDQFLLGSGFNDDFPRPGFGGYLFAAVTGKGAPSNAEMGVLERYLAAGS